MPYVFLTDEALPLCHNILFPYPGHNTGEGQVYNFRLSDAQRMVESTFGILAAQWRVYCTVLAVSPTVAEKIVNATCMLHNFLRRDVLAAFAPTLTKEPSLGMQNVPRLGTVNHSRDTVAVRDRFAEYLMSPAGRDPCIVFPNSTIYFRWQVSPKKVTIVTTGMGMDNYC